MHPRDTVYRLATSGDLRRCHALMREQGEQATLSWLTVVAEREGTLLGFLSSQLKQMVIAGPLVVSTAAPRPGWIALRLVEAYEVVLQRARVTAFWFHVDASNTRWRHVLDKLGFQPEREGDTGTWYRRRIA